MTRFRWLTVCAALALASPRAGAQDVPLDGFFPLVGIGLTDEFIFDDLLGQSPVASSGVSGNLLGAGGVPNYDIALLDTGAGLSLLTDAAFDDFGLGEPGQGGGTDGYRGTQTVPVGGATGVLNVPINDPLGLYATGLQDRTGAGAALLMNNAALEGQTNTATLTFPPESDLPNVVGLPFASQYTTRIRNDQPQVFELEGKTVRTPAVDFLPLGSGGLGISRKAQLGLDPGAAFTQAPGYFQNILNIVDGIPVHENPQLPTGLAGGIATGGLFVEIYASNEGASLGSPSSRVDFFFDTGASVTVMSQASAATLGFDVVTDEPEFTISILGSGGEISDVPGFFLEEITLPALGGDITATNVPVVVLDVTDVSDPGNIVPGIFGTNLLAGRNVVIDPTPSIGAGGESAGLYISDPVTGDFTWATSASTASWSDASRWDAAATPDLLSVARLTPTQGANQEAVVSGDQEAWNVAVSGGGAEQTMTVRIGPDASLTTFSGTVVNEGGVIALDSGTLDTQFVEVRGGLLTGDGEVRTGSGPIDGQVEFNNGTLAVGETAAPAVIAIDGRLSMVGDSVLLLDIDSSGADRVDVDGTAALGGVLAIDFDHASTPLDVGSVFTLLTYDDTGGDFGRVLLPDGYVWDLQTGAGEITLRVVGLGLRGDFNHDGVVGAADYTVWRDNFGLVYDAADYTVWRDNFGATLPLSTSVPEPTALALLAIAAGYAFASSRTPHAEQ